jgi:hypothetical protein
LVYGELSHGLAVAKGGGRLHTRVSTCTRVSAVVTGLASAAVLPKVFTAL